MAIKDSSKERAREEAGEEKPSRVKEGYSLIFDHKPRDWSHEPLTNDSPSGEWQIEYTQYECAFSVWTIVAAAAPTLQTQTVLSADPEMIVLLSGEGEMENIAPVCPLNTLKQFPLSNFHIRIVLS